MPAEARSAPGSRSRVRSGSSTGVASASDALRSGGHNTSTTPPGSRQADEIAAQRRRRRNESSYRSQKKRRRELKDQLIAARGGRCRDCGYSTSAAALEFHHREASTKEFEIGAASVSRERKWVEASKCDLVCANCHRTRHSVAPRTPGGPVVEFRRRTKQKAVALLGGRCSGCDREFAASTFEFHHLDPSLKDFAISADGVARPWERIAAELAKCVLVCANCHREIHAGVRMVERPDTAMSEAAGSYRSAVA